MQHEMDPVSKVCVKCGLTTRQICIYRQSDCLGNAGGGKQPDDEVWSAMLPDGETWSATPPPEDKQETWRDRAPLL